MTTRVTADGRGRRSGLRALLGGEAGLSLLEITISVAVLVIVILGAVQFAYVGRQNLDEEESKRTATELASRLLEERHVLPYAAAFATDTTVTVDQVAYHTVITAETGVPRPTLIRLVATTSWPMHTGGTRSVSLATFAPDHP